MTAHVADAWRAGAGRVDRVAAVPGTVTADRSPAVPVHAGTVRSWPLLVLAAPAAAEVFSGWAGIAQTTQMISPAVCALTTLAFTLDAARLAATAKAAGSGRKWPSSPATRTVTSYLPGGLSMSGTVGVICDICGAGWPSPANDMPTRLTSHGNPSAARHGGHRAPPVPMLLW